MNLNISADRMELTPAMEEYVKAKTQKLWDHFEMISAHVRLSHDHELFVARADWAIAGKPIHIAESHADMYAAIDKLMKRSHENLTREKGRKAPAKKALRKLVNAALQEELRA